jgi:leucyl aminopeptidase
MQIEAATTPPNAPTAIAVFQNDKGEPLVEKEMQRALRGMAFKADLKETKIIQGRRAPTILVGLGKRKEFDAEKARKFAAQALRTAQSMRYKTFALRLPEDSQPTAQAAAEGLLLTAYEFKEFKTEPKSLEPAVETALLLTTPPKKRPVAAGIAKATTLCRAAYLVRDLVNTPASNKTPTVLAEKIAQLAKRHGFSAKVFGRIDLQKMGMNAFLGVARGSAEEPKLVVLEYDGGGDTLCLVGKGITFDSGGINLKPTGFIETMKSDMAGAATVVATILAAAELKLPVKLVGICPFTENMPGGTAQKPGDVVKAYNGKTIEIDNTDAEGRLILADALAYAAKNHPQAKATVELSTLTGAMVYALGHVAAGYMTKDDSLAKRIEESSKRAYELVWRFPLFEEYFDDVKGVLADVKNTGKKGEAGSIAGATFLSNFAAENFAHVDIAGTAYLDEERDYYRKGGTGWGVRLLVDLVEHWKK